MSTNMVNNLFKIIAILFAFFTSINGDCILRISEDPELRPKIFHIIGSLKVQLPVAKESTYLTLFERQQVELFCDTEFESPTHFNRQTNIRVRCEDNQLRNSVCRHCYPDDQIQCSQLKWKLYESSNHFAWCPNNMISYILARSRYNSSSNYEYLAGVCYDTYNNALKSLFYRMAPKFDDNFHPSILETFYTPGNEIEHHREIFDKKSFDERYYDNDVFKDWIKYSKYNFSSILQIPRINKQFNSGSFLDFPWWPSLRLGNWKRYEMALEKYIESANQTYDILAGLSDVVKAPVFEDCAKNFTLKVLHDNVNRHLPFYVWNYLRAKDSSSKVVIIGVNSPFYEFYAEEDVIFCKDICEEISWLKAESSTFRYSALGVIFCCSVEEVKASKRLDGFPEVNMDSLPKKLDLPPIPLATTTAETEYDD